MVIDPEVLLKEIETFKAHGLLAHPDSLVVAGRAHVVLPVHKEIDACREAGPSSIGTTKRGIGPTYESKASRSGLRMSDLMDRSRLAEKLERCMGTLAPLLKGLDLQIDQAAIVERYAALGEALEPYVGDASRYVYEQIKADKHVLLEGAHGVLLDLDHGTYPFVTSSSTTAGGACSAFGLAPRSLERVVGIVKSYQTRVGQGPFSDRA